MFMVLLILNNPDLTSQLLDLWEEAGTSGVTILPSTGLGRVRTRAGLEDDVPLLPSLQDFFEHEESQHRTLISVVRERAVVDRIITATLGLLGDLNQPQSGFLVVLPVLEAYGLDRKGR